MSGWEYKMNSIRQKARFAAWHYTYLVYRDVIIQNDFKFQ